MILDIIRLMRPKQWTKNFFALAPLFFALRYPDWHAWQNSLLAMLCFTLAAGGIYIFNDILDLEEDKIHPRKKHRPIASGKVPAGRAATIALGLVLTSMLLTSVLPISCFIILGMYICLQVLYTLSLKHKAIFDVLVIASGFVLRVLIGGYAIGVPVSPWIIVTTYLLALFIGFGKRYHEFSVAGYNEKRRSLEYYNTPLLNQLIGISCVSSLLSYTLYTVETARLLNKTALVGTVLFVIIGLFRYLQVLYVDEQGGEPETVLLTDKVFILNGFTWVVVTLWILSA